jgi:hypothetical protein
MALFTGTINQPPCANNIAQWQWHFSPEVQLIFVATGGNSGAREARQTIGTTEKT